MKKKKIKKKWRKEAINQNRKDLNLIDKSYKTGALGSRSTNSLNNKILFSGVMAS